MRSFRVIDGWQVGGFLFLALVAAGCGENASAAGVDDAGEADGAIDPMLDGATDAGDAGQDATADSCGRELFRADLFPACECPGARCLSVNLIDGDPNELADCGEAGKCVPDEFVATNGYPRLERCTSLLGIEGRCLSKCFPGVAEQIGRFEEDVCPETHLCIPCFDAVTGLANDICELGCEGGATQEPPTVIGCCPGPDDAPRGTCLPTNFFLESEREGLNEGSCPADEGYLCLPHAVSSPTMSHPPCEVVRDENGYEGVCLPDCVASLEANLDVLARGDCGDRELCVPCVDEGGMPNGLCDAEPPSGAN